MVVAAGGVGLPYFDHRVADRRAVAVEHAPFDRDALASRAARGEVVPSFVQQRTMKKRTDGLRRRHAAAHLTPPSVSRSCGVALRPRSTMSKR